VFVTAVFLSSNARRHGDFHIASRRGLNQEEPPESVGQHEIQHNRRRASLSSMGGEKLVRFFRANLCKAMRGV
jgi:hypothetical protein